MIVTRLFDHFIEKSFCCINSKINFRNILIQKYDLEVRINLECLGTFKVKM